MSEITVNLICLLIVILFTQYFIIFLGLCDKYIKTKKRLLFLLIPFAWAFEMVKDAINGIRSLK